MSDEPTWQRFACPTCGGFQFKEYPHTESGCPLTQEQVDEYLASLKRAYGLDDTSPAAPVRPSWQVAAKAARWHPPIECGRYIGSSLTGWKAVSVPAVATDEAPEPG